MKSFKALFVVALVLAVAVPAFAETQNVKVSGSIDSYAFFRNDYDLLDGNDASVVPVASGSVMPAQSHSGNVTQRSEADEYFRTNTQVEVSADLTDNVSTVINIVNQRDWNAEPVEDDGSELTAGTSTQSNNEFDIELDLAYVQMKEIFYSPLTLTLGRQDLWFGRGFIIGNNNRAWDTQGLTQADEYSVTTAFDALRATLDFNPWTIDLVYSKIDENTNNPEDDVDLYIANVNYKFAEYNAVAEGYYVGEFDRSALSGTASAGTHDNDTNTIGGRVQFDPISQITLGGELAYQFGNYRAIVTAPTERDRDAWALDIFGTYRWDNTWKPELTLEYVHFSGEADTGSGSTQDYGAWNGLYRGRFWTAYADFREFVYATADSIDQPATTNQQFIQVKGALKPLEDLLLEASFTYLWTDEDVHTVAGDMGSPTRSEEIGYEVDLQATYDYTEDVSFGLLAGWFVPGDFYNSPEDSTATDLVGSVKVTF
jgi:hypothetical protein